VTMPVKMDVARTKNQKFLIQKIKNETNSRNE
jgi:hypothetical protein